MGHAIEKALEKRTRCGVIETIISSCSRGEREYDDGKGLIGMNNYDCGEHVCTA